jgi:hypothetical protein
MRSVWLGSLLSFRSIPQRSFRFSRRYVDMTIYEALLEPRRIFTSMYITLPNHLFYLKRVIDNSTT